MSRLFERDLKAALFRYQLMANIVGVLIIPLFVFAGLRAGFGGFKAEVAIFGVAHGYLFIVYLITAGLLLLKARMHVAWIVLIALAGIVPGLTFVVEWFIVTRKVQPLLAAQSGNAAGAETGEGVSPGAR